MPCRPCIPGRTSPHIAGIELFPALGQGFPFRETSPSSISRSPRRRKRPAPRISERRHADKIGGDGYSLHSVSQPIPRRAAGRQNHIKEVVAAALRLEHAGEERCRGRRSASPPAGLQRVQQIAVVKADLQSRRRRPHRAAVLRPAQRRRAGDAELPSPKCSAAVFRRSSITRETRSAQRMSSSRSARALWEIRTARFSCS